MIEDIFTKNARFYDILIESRAYGLSHLTKLAEATADRFNIPLHFLNTGNCSITVSGKQSDRAL
jgi:hypothetical protein